jgi:uncharacterized damage-inducible protein DinB
MTDREFFIQRWFAEVPSTEGIFTALPEENLDYKPHQKTRSAKEIVGHLIGHPDDMNELIETGNINHRNQTAYNKIADAVSIYKTGNSKLEQLIKSVNDDLWNNKKGKFYIDGNFIYEAPVNILMWGFLFDTIHHRGQLTTYIRPMGGKNPSVYGPTADNPM